MCVHKIPTGSLLGDFSNAKKRSSSQLARFVSVLTKHLAANIGILGGPGAIH